VTDEYGPIEFVVMLIPDDGVDAVLETLVGQVRGGGIRLLDAVVLERSATGVLTIAEVADGAWGGLALEAEGITTEEDAHHFAAVLPTGERAVLLAVESVWLKELSGVASAVRGEVLHADRIPAAVVNAAVAAVK
jgi:hypothetical protein